MSRTVDGLEPYPALMLAKPRPPAKVDAGPRPFPALTVVWVAMMVVALCQMLRPTLAAIVGG